MRRGIKFGGIIVVVLMIAGWLVHSRQSLSIRKSGEQLALVQPRQNLDSEKKTRDRRVADEVERIAESVKIAPKPTAGTSEWTATRWLELYIQGAIESRPQLGFSHEEMRIVADTFCTYQLIRAAYEKDLVQEVSFDGTKLVLSIPPYPEAGRKLRDMYYSELDNRLGKERSRLLDDFLGTELDDRFLGFGITHQTIEVTPIPNSGGLVQVVRNAVSDPRYTTWGEKKNSFGGSLTSPTLRPSERDWGEYQGIAAAVRKHFR